MKTLKIFMILVIFGLLAQLNASHHEGRKEHLLERMKKELAISDEQAKKIKLIMNENRDKSEKIKINIKKIHLEIQEAMLAENPNESKIKSLIDEKFTLKAQVQKGKISKKLAIKKVLTDEQWKKWEQIYKIRKKYKKYKKRKSGKKCTKCS